MILQALANYYERLSMREDSGLAPRGFSPEQVSYEIVLDTGIHQGRNHAPGFSWFPRGPNVP